jgi:pilus assembly protein Flp/PilA
MKSSIVRKKRQTGQGLVEYGLILTMVSVVVIAVMLALGPRIGNVFSSINNSMTTTGISSSGSVSAPTSVPTAVPTAGSICYLRWTGHAWVHWYDNTPEQPGPCP